MNTLITLVMAGALVATSVVAGVNDQLTEERYRAKYGRYTPAEESRRKAAEVTRAHTATACEREACCQRIASKASVNRRVLGVLSNSDADARFRAKWGRGFVDAEAQTLDAACNLTATRKAQQSVPNANTPNYDALGRLQAKTGRTPAPPTGTMQPAIVGPELVARALMGCMHYCCSSQE